MKTLLIVIAAGALLVFIGLVNQAGHAAMTRQTVTTTTRQQADTLSASDTDTLTGPPTIGAAFINRVLQAYNSPAAGQGQALYDLGKQYGIDPAYALAFFQHESSFGTRGEARLSKSLGNLRCIQGAACRDGYAWFPSWEAGFQAWYELIRNLYVGQWGLSTVEQVIPKYAPSADNNDEAAYIAAVKQAVAQFRAQAS